MIGANFSSRRNREKQKEDTEYYRNNFNRKECIWPKIKKLCKSQNLELNVKPSRVPRGHGKLAAPPGLAVHQAQGNKNSNLPNQKTDNEVCYCGRASNHEVSKDIPESLIQKVLEKFERKSQTNDDPTITKLTCGVTYDEIVKKLNVTNSGSQGLTKKENRQLGLLDLPTNSFGTLEFRGLGEGSKAKYLRLSNEGPGITTQQSGLSGPVTGTTHQNCTHGDSDPRIPPKFDLYEKTLEVLTSKWNMDSPDLIISVHGSDHLEKKFIYSQNEKENKFLFDNMVKYNKIKNSIGRKRAGFNIVKSSKSLGFSPPDNY